MTNVFVGGSRKVTRLNVDVRKRLDQILAKQLCVFVGDANGADKAIQTYLSQYSYPHVVVFCTGGECRNNVGSWKVRTVDPPHQARDFAFFTAKDAAMAREAEFGLMLWDGESAGTIVNVARMVASNKPVVLYISPGKTFVTLKTRQDLSEFLMQAPSEVCLKVNRYISEHAKEFSQGTIFAPPNSA